MATEATSGSSSVRGRKVFDDMQRLRDNPRLTELLSHYIELGNPDRSLWQQRLMEMDGIDSKELSRMHGELIAWDWIEQNPTTTNRILGSLYRVTLHGIRDFYLLQGVECPERPESVVEKARPKLPPRRRKQKTDIVENGESLAVVPPDAKNLSPMMATPA
jgi:hypothetical protein